MLGGISPPAWSICRLTLDHHLTTTVQRYYKMPEKPVVTTNNGLFLGLAATMQNQQSLRFNASLDRPVVVLRRQVPGVRIPSGAPRAASYGCCSFCFARILWGSKRRDSNSLCPALCVPRGRNAPVGVSRARLGESLRAHLKTHCNVFFVLILCQNSFSSISFAASVYCPFASRSFLS